MIALQWLQRPFSTPARALTGAVVGLLGLVVILPLQFLHSLSGRGAQGELSLYAIAFALAGAFAGAALPFTRRRLGAVVVGIIFVQPIIAALLLSDPRFTWASDYPLWIWFSVAGGALTGLKVLRGWNSEWPLGEPMKARPNPEGLQ
jgi:hypothetical protein